MLDIQFIRENPELVAEKSRQKGYDINVVELLQLDDRRKALVMRIDQLRAERNEHAAGLKQGKPSPEQIEQGKKIKTELAELEVELEPLDERYWAQLKAIPNMPLEMVPIGDSENQNKIIRTVGERPEFNFAPKNHAVLAEAKGWLDKERAVKIAGARFVYTKGDLVRLEFALWQYGMEVVSNEAVLKEIITKNNLEISSKPFMPVLPPAVAKKEVFEATGRLNREEQTYKFEDEDLWMNASAEHTISPMYMNEIVDYSKLPIRYVGYTTAFRKEAGTYGKDTEGIFRLHQFNKLEMESFTDAASSFQEHLLMVAIQEYLMQQLGLPYHVLEKCTADIGRPNAKGVDIEVWLPSQNTYRETHTADYITDYQARAMKTRVRMPDGQIELVHTNDATVFSQRPLIAIIENYQTSEGDIIVPEVLRPYMSGKERI